MKRLWGGWGDVNWVIFGHFRSFLVVFGRFPWNNAAPSWSNDHAVGDISLARELDLVNLVWDHMRAQHPSEPSEALANSLIVDTSQSITHSPWAFNKVRSLTAASRYYHYGTDQMLTPQMQFNLLGFNGVSLLGLSRNQSFELASQAMSMPVISMLTVLALTTL